MTKQNLLFICMLLGFFTQSGFGSQMISSSKKKVRPTIWYTSMGFIVKNKRGAIGKLETPLAVQFVLVPLLSQEKVMIYEVPFDTNKPCVSKRMEPLLLGSKKIHKEQSSNNDNYSYIRDDYENAMKKYGRNIVVKKVTEDNIQYQAQSSSDIYVYEISKKTGTEKSFERKLVHLGQLRSFFNLARPSNSFRYFKTHYDLYADSDHKTKSSELKS